MEKPSIICFLLVLNRILMIILGRELWIYGYMILYLIYGIALVIKSAENNFPLKEGGSCSTEAP